MIGSTSSYPAPGDHSSPAVNTRHKRVQCTVPAMRSCVGIFSIPNAHYVSKKAPTGPTERQEGRFCLGIVGICSGMRSLAVRSVFLLSTTLIKFISEGDGGNKYASFHCCSCVLPSERLGRRINNAKGGRGVVFQTRR